MTFLQIINIFSVYNLKLWDISRCGYNTMFKNVQNGLRMCVGDVPVSCVSCAYDI